MKNDFLQNMAPNAKRSAVVTLILGAIAAVLYMFAVQPFESELEQLQKKLSEVEDSQRRINLDLKSANNIKKELIETNSQLESYQKAFLTPLLESYSMRDAPAGNPFAGELRLSAAYRLSFELGYAIPNRMMILGDMALATEALSGIAYAQAMDIREYRHRVQTMRASDVNIYWPRIAGEVSAIIDARLESLMQEHWDSYLAYISSGPPRT